MVSDRELGVEGVEYSSNGKRYAVPASVAKPVGFFSRVSSGVSSVGRRSLSSYRAQARAEVVKTRLRRTGGRVTGKRFTRRRQRGRGVSFSRSPPSIFTAMNSVGFRW